MKFLNDNVVYEFTVAQDDAGHTDGDLLNHPNAGPPYNFYYVKVRHRLFRLQQRQVVSDYPLHIPRDNDPERNRRLILSVLQQLEVPLQTAAIMAEHFIFYIERLGRRNRNDATFLAVLVCLNVKEINSERAAAAQSRIAHGRASAATAVAAARIGRTEREREVWAMDGGRRRSVEELEKVRIDDDDRYRGKDCVICLEEFEVGGEVVKMPCLHLFHKDCIAKWLAITDVCPYCRS